MKPTTKSWQVLPCLVLLSSSLFAQWNKNAGINPTQNTAATVQASSENGAKVAGNAIDGDEDTRWESKSPLPSGFISDNNQNVFYNGRRE